MSPIFDGFMTFAGDEVINVARTKAYVAAGYAPAGAEINVCDDCDSLLEMIGEDGPYSSPLIDDAPWFETSNPDSWDFAGIIPLEITGTSGSTRTAATTELTTDGGVASRVRYAGRTIAVSALLVGKTGCAVESGLSWLTTVLGGTSCSGPRQQGPAGACSGDELCMFTCCPDTLDETPVEGEYVTVPVETTDPGWRTVSGTWESIIYKPPQDGGRFTPVELPAGVVTNLVVNPSFEVDTSHWQVSQGTLVRTAEPWGSRVGDWSGKITAGAALAETVNASATVDGSTAILSATGTGSVTNPTVESVLAGPVDVNGSTVTLAGSGQMVPGPGQNVTFGPTDSWPVVEGQVVDWVTTIGANDAALGVQSSLLFYDSVGALAATVNGALAEIRAGSYSASRVSTIAPYVAPAVIATNLTPNPNLEAGSTTGWATNDATRWATANSTTSPISGSRSLVTTRQAASPSRTASSILINSAPGVRIPVTAGQQYTIGLDVKTENPPVVEATNLAFNPIGTAPVTTYWTPTRGTLAAAADYLRLTVTDATVAAQAQRITSPLTVGAAGSIVVAPGQTIRVVGQVRSSASNGMTATIQWMDAANAAISSTSGIVKTANPSTWTEVEVSGTAPANTVYAQVQFGIYTGARAVNDTFDVQKVYVGTAMAPMPWFDGNTAASGDYSYRWTGTANGSTSERVRANPPVKTVTATNAASNPNLESGLTGWATANASLYTISLDTTAPISDTQSAMLTRTATSPDAYVGAFNVNGMTPNAWIPISNGVPITVGFDIKTELADRAIRVSLNQYDSAGAFISATPTTIPVASTVAGQVQRVVQTITPNAVNAARGYLIVSARSNGANPAAGERFWMDNLRIGGDGAYFDGDTPASGGNFYRWTGARLTSTSERYTETPNLRKISLNASFDVGGSSTATVIDNVQPGVVTRIVHTLTAPAGSSGMYPACIVDASNAAVVIATGERVWHDNLVIEKGATSGAYWDGSSPASGTLSYRWTGAVNASTSQRLQSGGTTVKVVMTAVRTNADGGGAPAAGSSFYVDAAALFIGLRRAGHGYIDGDTRDTTLVTYDWTGTPGLSTSTATAIGAQPELDAPAQDCAEESIFTWNLSTQSGEVRVIPAAKSADTGAFVWYGPSYTVHGQASLPVTADQAWGDWIPVLLVDTAPGAEPFIVNPSVRRTRYTTVEECAENLMRSYLDVTTTSGPTVVEKIIFNCGEYALKVEWTMFVGNPFIYGPERLLAHRIWTHDALPSTVPGKEGSLAPNVDSLLVGDITATESSCSTKAPAFVSLSDPNCPGFITPPAVPTITDDCLYHPATYSRTVIAVPASYAPGNDEGTLVITLTSDHLTKRGVRIRIYPDPTGDGYVGIENCDFCEEFTVTYLPGNAVMTINGVTRRITTRPPGSNQEVVSSASVRGPNGGPFDFPALLCNMGYLVVVDNPNVLEDFYQSGGQLWVDVAMRTATG